MSMNLYIKGADQIELLRAVRFGIDPDALMRSAMGQRAAATGTGFGRVISIFSRQPQVPEQPSDDTPTLDLAKSWHILHFLLARDPWAGEMPAASLMAGREVGRDLGYGCARILSIEETEAFAAHLAALSADRLIERIDRDELAEAELYGVDLEDEDDGELDELVDIVEHYFPLLQAHVTAAASARQGLILWMM